MFRSHDPAGCFPEFIYESFEGNKQKTSVKLNLCGYRIDTFRENLCKGVERIREKAEGSIFPSAFFYQ